MHRGLSTLYFVIFLIGSAFGNISAGNDPDLSYTRLTGGLHEPTFQSGRSDFVMVDINDNGRVDILSIGDHGSPMIGSTQHGVMVWFNNGDGTFSLHMEGHFGYGGIAVGDVNNDGFKDVAYGMHHPYSNTDFGDQYIEVALGDGSGMNWTPYDDGLATNGETYGMFGTDLGDVNNNGLLDLVSISFGCCAGFHVYLNQGDGSWVPSFGLLGENADNLIQFADLNNNGHLDFIAGHSLGTAYFGDGQGNFVNNDSGLPELPPLVERFGVSVGDINNDGSHGVAFVNSQGGVEAWEFDQGNNTWTSYSGNLPTSGSYRFTQLFDMNANGYTDLVAFGNGLVQIWFGDGQGNWNPGGSFQTDGTGPSQAFRVGGDLNQNGHGDIVLLIREGTGSNPNHFYVLAENTIPDSLWVRGLYPKGNETFYSGAVRFIQWASAVPGSSSSSVKIEFSEEGPDGPWSLVEEGVPNNGRYQWTVPDANSENCHLKFTVTTADESHSMITQAPFTILGYPSYTITALPNNSEYGNVEGAGEYDQGEEVNLVAIPNTGYHFQEWVEDDETVMDGDEPAGENYTFYATKDRDLLGVFEINTYTILATPNNSDFGTVEGSGTYQHQEEVTLTASSNSGYHFLYWTENETVVYEDSVWVFDAEEDRELLAIFEPETYSLTFEITDQTGEPVEGAIITLNGNQNDAGVYVFNHVEPGVYDYLVTADGYFDATGSVTLSDQDKTTEVTMEADDTQTITPAFEGLKVYPNPARDKLYVKFYNHKPTTVGVSLVNMHNQTIRSATKSGKGQQQVFFNVEGLSSGLYLLQLSFDGIVHQKKIMIKPL